MASLTGYRKPTRWTVTIISAPQSARHDGSKRGNRRSVFLLTLDLRREMSGGSTQRLRLGREKGKKKKKKKLSGMKDGTLIQGSSCVRSLEGHPGCISQAGLRLCVHGISAWEKQILKTWIHQENYNRIGPGKQTILTLRPKMVGWIDPWLNTIHYTMQLKGRASFCNCGWDDHIYGLKNLGLSGIFRT